MMTLLSFDINTIYFYVTIRLTVIFLNLTTGKTNFRSQLKMLSTVLYHYLKSPLYHSSNTRRKSQSAFLTLVVNFENPNKVSVGYLKVNKPFSKVSIDLIDYFMCMIIRHPSLNVAWKIGNKFMTELLMNLRNDDKALLYC